MERNEMLSMMHMMAEHGHSPKSGCITFSYGYDESFEKIKKIYLEKRLNEMGNSAEKFVIGPYGSGKTHFCRHIMELGEQMGFVTSEVQLNKNVDFTKPLIVYKQLASEIKVPGKDAKGMRSLVANCYHNVQKKFHDRIGEQYDELLLEWIDGIDSYGFELTSFGRVIKKALKGYAVDGDNSEVFQLACRWLEGEISNKEILNVLGESRVPSSEEALHGQRAMNSLYQFIRKSEYPGSIVVFDEAEQSFSVNKKKRQQILSMLQSGINNIADLRNGAVLVLYSLTLDIAEHFNEFPALKQRLDDPIGGKTFFEGDVHAPKIILEYGHGMNPQEHLIGIGERLISLFFDTPGIQVTVSKEEVLEKMKESVEDITSRDPSPSNRRTVAKNTAYMLTKLYEEGELPSSIPNEQYEEEE